MLLVLPLLMMVPFLVYYAATGAEVGASVTRLVDLTDPTPAGLAYLNLSLAGLIPLTWLIVRYLHGLRPRWLSSIRPRLRWGYLFVCFGLVVRRADRDDRWWPRCCRRRRRRRDGRRAQRLHAELRDFLLVVLLLTPLQAAAEEYAFRGYLLQAFGGLRPQPLAFAVGLSSLLFALAHGRAGRADLLRPVRLRRRGRHPRRSSPAASRPASRCTSSTTGWPSASPSRTATWARRSTRPAAPGGASP